MQIILSSFRILSENEIFLFDITLIRRYQIISFISLYVGVLYLYGDNLRKCQRECRW